MQTHADSTHPDIHEPNVLSLYCACSPSGLGASVMPTRACGCSTHFPKTKCQAKYGFAPDQAWLDHVRLSSARAPNGSSSFVSPDGLIFTNHHIAQECIHDLSTGGKDYMKNGFYAPTRADEAKCPGVEFRSCSNALGRHREGQRCRQARNVEPPNQARRSAKRWETPWRKSTAGSDGIRLRHQGGSPYLSARCANLYKDKKV